ncbi:hypothetical protein KFE98_04690 [bacterium SCSIO 12741]|nr:hypothetical protein KFE98_04690 [bacterium SCSIO 12741]
MNWKVACLGIMCLCALESTAQSLFIPLEQSYNQNLDRKLNQASETHSTLVKPLVSGQWTDTLSKYDEGRWQRKQRSKWLGRKLKNENLIVVDTGDFYLTIDPLMNFQYGQDLAEIKNNDYSTNTRGFLVQGAIGKQFSFYSSFYENQSFFPTYLSDEINATGVVPGQGRFKEFQTTGFDYAMASGAFSFRPWKMVEFQFGHGKSFVGEGYRSLLQSDVSFNYPYFRTHLSFLDNKLHYYIQYASLQELERIPATTSSEAQFIREAGTFHTLSYVPIPQLEVALFEGTVWQNWDSTGTQRLPWNYYVPVIGFNSAYQGWATENSKTVFGINLKVNPVKNWVAYGQLAMDEYLGTNWSWQAGIKGYDLFGLKDLNMRVEYNQIAANMYGHANSRNSYGHYNQALAHPSGNNLTELIGQVNYSFRDFFVQAKVNWINKLDRDVAVPLENAASPNLSLIVVSDQELIYQEYAVGYLINPKTNMRLKVGYLGRVLDDVRGANETDWVYISFETALQNIYYDF